MKFLSRSFRVSPLVLILSIGLATWTSQRGAMPFHTLFAAEKETPPAPQQKRDSRAAHSSQKLVVGQGADEAVVPTRNAASPSVRALYETKQGVVACVDPRAARAGLRMLQEGGNAIDAAVATALALAVTHPEAGNLGGGGFMVVRLMTEGRPEVFTVDFREKAPSRATRDMYLDKQGKLRPNVSDLGYLAVGVPGTPHGLWTAHQKGGKLPWKTVVAPALQLASEGISLDATLAASLARQQKDFLKMGGDVARIFLNPKGQPWPRGTWLVQKDLAATLQRISDRGADGFYRGKTAELLERAFIDGGGIIRQDDLAAYRAVIRQPVRTTYRGYEVISMAPPSGGGTVLIEMLNMLEGYDLRGMGHNSAGVLHLYAEVMKRAYFDRAKYLADADFVEVPVTRLTSKANAEGWRKEIGENATRSDSFGSGILSERPESEETTHISVYDSTGSMVACTITLEGSYGAKVVAGGTGFLLNNEMRDFNIVPGMTDRKGRIGTLPNQIAPGKRMLSSQTPTIVLKEGHPFLIVGSPGGRTITNTVLQVIVNAIDFQMPIEQAVAASRVHHQWMPDVLTVEPGISAQVVKELQDRGHVVTRRNSQGDAHAIRIDPGTGNATSGIDRRVRRDPLAVELKRRNQ